MFLHDFILYINLHSFQCDDLLLKYGNQAYDMLLQMTADSKAVCTQIGFCSGTKVSHKRMKLLRTILKNLNKIKVKLRSLIFVILCFCIVFI